MEVICECPQIRDTTGSDDLPTFSCVLNFFSHSSRHEFVASTFEFDTKIITIMIIYPKVELILSKVI